LAALKIAIMHATAILPRTVRPAPGVTDVFAQESRLPLLIPMATLLRSSRCEARDGCQRTRLREFRESFMKMSLMALAITLGLLTTASRAGAQGSANSVQAPMDSTRHDGVKTLRGTLEKVDTTGKTFVVKARDGSEATFHFSDATVVHGLGPQRSAAMLASEEGMDVVVRYSADETASSIFLTRGATVDLAIGTIVTIDPASKTISVTTADGEHESFQLGEDCKIYTAQGVEKSVSSGHVLKKGGLVVLYFSEEGGHRVVRAIDEISHSV
jgi:hypothetical protein